MKKIFFVILLLMFSSFAFSEQKNKVTKHDEKILTQESNEKMAEFYDSDYKYITDAKKQFFSGESVNELVKYQKELDKVMSDKRDASLTVLNSVDVNQITSAKDKVDELDKKADDLREKIANLTDKIKSDVDLTNVYNYLKEIFSKNVNYIQKVAKVLLKLFAIFEILNILINKPTEIPIAPFMKLITKGAILYYLIERWNTICLTLLEDVKRFVNYTVSLGDNTSRIFEFNPTKVFEYFTDPAFVTFSHMGWKDLLNIKIFVFVPLLLILCYLAALICLEFFMAVVEFYFIAFVSVLLLPFLILQQTQNIGGRVIGVIVYQLVKMFITFYFIRIGVQIVKPLGSIDVMKLSTFSVGISILFSYLVSVYFVKVFVGKSGIFSNMLVGGGSALSGRDATGLLRGAIATAVGAVAVAYRMNKLGADSSGRGGLIQSGLKRLGGAAKNGLDRAKKTINKS
ncbi:MULTISPECIES: hypothetical protein [unclassified Fusobacterium]|uniref:hypothetical protein n=1 Tax=unclassified Fusobacterium TaxID=2648384 RepID=UPI001B8B9A03|nr:MULTISPECIES: hypothetical protein [unclassified Fusobacterium]MBR8700491.1 hypothetical protein [Fusobacterium sp. DD45]MBR8710244.1 hypothetical protein [Fusobacterium sp. DD28]MBR8750766.1 hypothetical protein [Fusobacterium sp. DD26]